MISRNTVLSILGCLLLVFGLAANQPEIKDSQQQHCYSLLSPVNVKSSDSSKIIEAACFNSFSESIKAATKGRVNLDPSIRPGDLTDDVLNNVGSKSTLADQIVIGIDWDYTNYGASSYTWVVTGSACTDTTFFDAPTMPSGWDNRVSSSKAYSTCNYFYHYQNSNFGGTSIVCNMNCPGMGALDNSTSSEKWRKNP